MFITYIFFSPYYLPLATLDFSINPTISQGIIIHNIFINFM